MFRQTDNTGRRDMALIDEDFKTLTKAELVELVYETVTPSKAEAKELVDAFFEIMASELEQGREVKLAGFGIFELRDKAARPGRNPRTGEDALISARRVVTFRASRKLKKLVQDGTAGFNLEQFLD